MSALLGLTQAQSDVGIDVRVLATWRRGEDLELSQRLQGAGIHIQLIGPGVGPLCWHPRIVSTLAVKVAEVDIVHIHGLWEQVQHVAAATAYRLGVPYIIRPCGMLDPWSLQQKPLKKRLYMAWRLRKTLNRAARIHFTTETERDLTKDLHIRTASVVEPNGVDLSEFGTLPQQGTFRSRFPQINDRPLILFLSRLHHKKGLDLLIPAFARSPIQNAVLVIAGPDSHGYRNEVQAMVDQAGVAQRVVFTGMLHGRDRVAAYVDADLFVLPSYQENFGIAVIESLAAGTPVLISDQVNIHSDIAAAGVGGVVPMRVDALAAELSKWLSDENLRRPAAAAARPFAIGHYDWGKIAQSWASRYQDIIDGGRG